MTLEKSIPRPALIENSYTSEPAVQTRRLLGSSRRSQVASTNTHLITGNLNIRSGSVLNRKVSDTTILTSPSVGEISDRSSTSIGNYGSGGKSFSKSKLSPTRETCLHTSLDSHRSDTHMRERNFTNIPQSDLCLKKAISSPTERVHKRSHETLATTSRNTVCSKENLPKLPSPMPKSSGRSSRSSAAQQSVKQEHRSEGNGPSVRPQTSLSCLDLTPKNRGGRPHSVEPRETTTCSFFYFIRKKKKSQTRSPSPEHKNTQSNTHSFRLPPSISCSSAQSGPRSERTPSASDKDRRPSGQSQTSSRLPLTSVSSNPPASVTSPTSPLITPTSPPTTSKPQKYKSRSRSKHRRDRRRHRSSKHAFRTHPDDRLKHEDLPPHPSLLKKAAARTSSEPSRPNPYLKPSINQVSGRDNKCNNISDKNTCNNISDSNCNNISDKNIGNNCDTNSRLRKNSKPESSVNAKVSSVSGNNRKDSRDWPLNLRRKSQQSATKTDVEEESHYQLTTSSSEQLSKPSYRSQSLPSFRGDGFLLDADTKVISDPEDFELNPSDMKAPLNLSLCGCGFLGMYHLGVVSSLTMRGLPFLERVEKVAGASAGALMAAVLVTARDKIEESAEHVQNLAKEMRRKPLGALTPGYSFTRSLRVMMDDILPEDAHETAKGKLYVSLTNSDTRKNEMFSDFKSRDELIEVLVASCYIPVYAGIKVPTIRGKKYIDGGLSDNLPRFETGRTITVSPFDGRSDIGPKQGQEVAKKAHFINLHNQDIQVTMNNLKKGTHAFFPPKRQTLQEYYEKGRYDASRFLIREGLYDISYPSPQKPVLYESSV